MMNNDLPYFRFWCYKVIPLVYDDSLSYYETLCKVVDYINHLIDDDKVLAKDIQGLKEDMAKIQKWIDDFDTSYAEEIVRNAIATMIFVDISDAGYIIYHIPDGWNEVSFKTTGLDISLPYEDEYGHLVLQLFDNEQGTKENN